MTEGNDYRQGLGAVVKGSDYGQHMSFCMVRKVKKSRSYISRRGPSRLVLTSCHHHIFLQAAVNRVQGWLAVIRV